MEVEFADEDLRRLYSNPTFRHSRYGNDLTRQFRKKVGVLKNAQDVRDLFGMRSLRFEKLLGDRTGQHSIRLNDQWRLVFELGSGEGPVRVLEIVDYH